MPASLRCAAVIGVGAPVSGSLPGRRLRERDDIPDRVAAGEEHQHPVPAERDAAVRRRPVPQRVEQEAELRPAPPRATARSRRRPAAACPAGGSGSTRRRSRCRCRRGRRRRPAAPPGSVSNLSAHSGSGEVNGWCTAVQPPSPSSSNIGASTTQVNAQADRVDQPAPRADLQPGRAEQRAGRAVGVQRAKKTQSPGPAPVAAAEPGPLGRPKGAWPPARRRTPSRRRRSARRPGPGHRVSFAQSCQPSSSLRDWAAPPGMTTAPTCSAWKTRKSVCPRSSRVRSASSHPKRRSGLSEPKRAMASA